MCIITKHMIGLVVRALSSHPPSVMMIPVGIITLGRGFDSQSCKTFGWDASRPWQPPKGAGGRAFNDLHTLALQGIVELNWLGELVGSLDEIISDAEFFMEARLPGQIDSLPYIAF